MIKKTYWGLLMAAMFVAVMALPQEASAKKIEYLGHAYNGKVNKQKIPEGLGKLTVKNLIIEGTFADRTVTDAIVKVDDGTPLNNTFKGTVTYDESDKIRLKAGGTFTRWYLEKNCSETYFDVNQKGEQTRLSGSKIHNIQKSTETLTRDLVVDADGFMDLGMRIPQGDLSKEIANLMSIMKYDTQKFDIPEGLPFYLHAQPKEVFLDCGGYRYRKQIAQITNSANQTTITDKKGRRWTYSIIDYSMSNWRGRDVKTFQIEFKVTFLNGDYLWCKQPQLGNTDIDYQIGGWKKHYKNGAVVTVEYDESRYNANVSLSNISFFKQKSNIAKLWESEDLMLAPDAFGGITISNIQLNTPSKDVNSQITKELLPFVEGKGAKSSFEVYASQNKYGLFKNGRIYTNAEEKKIKEREQARERQQEEQQRLQKQQQEQQELQPYYQKYGKRYVDAFIRGDVLVGMPEGLILKWKNMKKTFDSETTRKYVLYDNNMWHPKHIYTVWVSNGKVTDVVIHH